MKDSDFRTGRTSDYISGRCHDCGADLTLQEMRDHNYYCSDCWREQQSKGLRLE